MGGVMVGGKVAVFCLRTHGVYYGGHVAGMAGTAGTLAFIPACCTGSGMETPKQPCLTRQVDPGRACSRCPVNSTELPAYRSSQGAAVPLAPNVPSSKGLRGDPSGRKAGGMQGMGGGGVFGMGISKLPERWWSPPLPTGHAGKYLCPDFAGRREGISFLRPPAAPPPGINPFTALKDGGRGLRCPPGTPSQGGELGRGAGWGKGTWWDRPRCQRGHRHKVPWRKAAAGGFAHGHPLGSSQGFVPGCRAACGQLGIGKGGENRASLHPLSCHTPARVPLASPYAQQHHGAFLGPAAREWCGEQDLPTDVYWQFANVKKKARRG